MFLFCFNSPPHLFFSLPPPPPPPPPFWRNIVNIYFFVGDLESISDVCALKLNVSIKGKSNPSLTLSPSGWVGGGGGFFLGRGEEGGFIIFSFFVYFFWLVGVFFPFSKGSPIPVVERIFAHCCREGREWGGGDTGDTHNTL